MKIVIPGGSGQIGTILARAFHREGHHVVVLSRRSLNVPWRTVEWNGTTAGPWYDELDGADAVINLAGRSVDCRYTPANRHAILQSRVLSTRIVGDAIARAARPPRVWLQASTATIYAHRFDAPNDEHDGVLGGSEPAAPSSWRFSIEVARAWEQAFLEADTNRTRKVALRSALTLSPDRDGVFDMLVWLVRHGLGGTVGSGRQFVSWIHYQDFIDAIRFLIDRDDLAGTVNVASPGPTPNADFMRTLRRAFGVPFGLPASGWMLEIGAALLRTETELILKSRRVVPARLLEHGFSFQFPDWNDAASDLARQWRGGRRRRDAGGSL